MLTKIVYKLTEQAQRERMLATGQPVARKQEQMVDLSAEDFALAQVDVDGNAKIEVWNGEFPWSEDCRVVLDHVHKSREDDARQREERKVQEAQAREKRIAQLEADALAFFDDPSARLSDSATYSWPRDNAVIDQYAREVLRRNETDREAKRQAEAQLEEEKLAYIVAWVAEHGDEDLKAQLADGCLDRAETLGMIATEFFAGLGVPAEHEVDTCSDRSCPCGSSHKDSLPREVYPAWRNIKSLLPTGSTWTFSAAMDCPHDNEYEDGFEAEYYVADLVVPCGPFKFERRVKIG